MKKLLFILILIIAAAVPAVPYYIGTMVEQNVRAEHQQAAIDASLSGLEIELVNYQRGLLQSTATSRIGLILPQQSEPLYVDMLHRISHIPQLTDQVIASVNSELVLGDEAGKVMGQLFKGQAPLNIRTRIFLDGHQEGIISSPSAQGEVNGKKENLAIDWQGMNGTLHQSADRNNLSAKLHMPGIKVSPSRAETASDETAESLTLNELRYSIDMVRGASGMWHGSGEGSIANIALNATEQGTPFSVLINAVNLSGKQSESNGLINASGVISANTVNVNGFMLSNAVYDVAIENIDANTMLAWQKATVEMMRSGTVNPENPFEPMAEYIPALFNAKPAIKFNDISVDSPMGRFAFKLDTRLDGQWDDMIMQNPALLMPMLSVKLDADMPRMIVSSMLKDQIRSTLQRQAMMSETEINPEELEATAQQTVEQQLAGLIAQGLIKEKGSQLQSQLEFNKGQLLVNGVDASAMVGGMM